MPSIKDFVEAMSTSWPVALTIFIGSAAALVGEAVGIAYLAALPSWIFGTAFLFAVFSGAIVIVAALQAFSAWVGRPFRRRRAEQWKANHVEQLNHLPPEEAHVLVWAVANNTQVFLARVSHERLEPLVAKGYLQMLPGHHSILKWPYRIPDHIWEALRKDADELPERSKIPNPLVDAWY